VRKRAELLHTNAFRALQDAGRRLLYGQDEPEADRHDRDKSPVPQRCAIPERDLRLSIRADDGSDSSAARSTVSRLSARCSAAIRRAATVRPNNRLLHSRHPTAAILMANATMRNVVSFSVSSYSSSAGMRLSRHREVLAPAPHDHKPTVSTNSMSAYPARPIAIHVSVADDSLTRTPGPCDYALRR